MLLKLVRTSTLIYLLHFIFSWELCPNDCPSDDQWHDDCCADSHNETSHALMKTHDWFMDLRSPLFLSIFYYRGELRSFCVRSCDSKLQAKVSNQIICIPSVCSRRHQQRQRAEEQALTTCTISRHECWTEKLHMEFWAHLLYNSKKHGRETDPASEHHQGKYLCQKQKKHLLLCPLKVKSLFLMLDTLRLLVWWQSQVAASVSVLPHFNSLYFLLVLITL